MPRPAADFADASRRFAALAARDGAAISVPGRSRLYAHGRRTPLAIVLYHGFTNAPEQWAQFATAMHARGHTLVVPRLPGHGHADRSATEIARVTRAQFLATCSEAVDIACGAGERVAVAGLSIGGAFALELALARTDVDRTVAIVPFIGVARLGATANAVLARVLRVAPNAFVPWDPGGKAGQTPPYAYPKFPTRTLGAALESGGRAYREARDGAACGRTTLLLNAREPACNNALSQTLAARLERRRPGSCDIVVLDTLPANHDIIDPHNPLARVDVVYPRLRELVEG